MSVDLRRAWGRSGKVLEVKIDVRGVGFACHCWLLVASDTQLEFKLKISSCFCLVVFAWPCVGSMELILNLNSSWLYCLLWLTLACLFLRFLALACFSCFGCLRFPVRACRYRYWRGKRSGAWATSMRRTSPTQHGLLRRRANWMHCYSQYLRGKQSGVWAT